MGTFIALFGIVVSALVAYSIAYMQRKQMRQIEARKDDPTLPLKPPVSSTWGNLLIFSTMAFIILYLVLIFNLPGPVTKMFVFQVAASLAALVLVHGMFLILLIIRAFEKSVVRGLLGRNKTS